MKPLPRVRKPTLHTDRGYDSSPCSWRPLGPQSKHGSTIPRRPPALSSYGNGSWRCSGCGYRVTLANTSTSSHERHTSPRDATTRL
ncbi:hypothetical protein E2C01_102255 [Portunus trituberculatus]|uniref:Uncharacterized protein n=1 Tax=Portunus trituberculatus TaxID=210409 RepID=A0A5B7KC28_PORTR|nr:hypothetical protein [Portunus trituberculatus]